MNRLRTMGWATLIGIWVAGSAAAALSVYMPAEEVSARATLVVEARVAEKRTGRDPFTGSLNTYITLDITHVHRGPGDLAEVVVREPGGRWGDLVHELDAVPSYLPGESVYAYLEPAADGALRTVGMFFGKFHLEETQLRGPLMATRDLEGRGTILGKTEAPESFTRNDLVALTAGVPYRRGSTSDRRVKTELVSERQRRDWSAKPPEWERLEWDPSSAASRPVSESARFVALSTGSPTRWVQADSGSPVAVHIQPGGNPLNDDQAAVDEIARALDAWTDVPQSRLHMTLGNTDFNYTGHYGTPASNYNGINIVLFDDPYDDISDPTGCGGVLAIGGYWRTGSTGAPINNVSFHSALQLYVIFNNNFECYLADPDNLAEVATHEIGHGIGFGHSSTFDSIMRASSYGNRGPRLGNDDIDAVHCHYPHTLTLLAPNGGEVWNVGSTESISWDATPEAGGDPGSVDLEVSIDGGATWATLATGTPNDGSYDWPVASEPGNDVRLRVARHAMGVLNSPYPTSSCSNDMSNGSLSVAAAAPVAGSIGSGLLMDKLAGGTIRVGWSPSCSGDVETYAIYEGDLAVLRSGSWNHAPAGCDAGNDRVEDLVPVNSTSYFLVAARAGSSEGDLGSSSSGQDRPTAVAACATREVSSCDP